MLVYGPILAAVLWSLFIISPPGGRFIDGIERWFRTRARDKARRHYVSAHEAGHVIAILRAPSAVLIGAKVTLVTVMDKEGDGSTYWDGKRATIPATPPTNETEREVLAQILWDRMMVDMAGFAGNAVIDRRPEALDMNVMSCSTVGNDLHDAIAGATAMERLVALDRPLTLDAWHWTEDDAYVPLPNKLGTTLDANHDLTITQRTLIAEAYRRARSLIIMHRRQFERLRTRLERRGALDEKGVARIMADACSPAGPFKVLQTIITTKTEETTTRP